MSSPALTTGRVMVKLQHCDCAAPAHLDVLAGTARAMNTVDAGGPVDRCVEHHTSAMRVRRVFSARETLFRPGERGSGFSDDEREQGLDRVLALELADPQAARDLAKGLANQDNVEWAMAEPLSFAPLDAGTLSRPLTRLPSADDIRIPHERVQAFEALQIEPGTPHITIAAIDTGVALEHAEFAGRLYGGIDTVDLGMGSLGGDVHLVGDSRGRDFCARDETGHGSHVSGIMSALGLKLPQGLAGLSSLAPVRALAAARGPDGAVMGIGGTMDIEAAIKAAADMGARVMNMSFGTSEHDLFDGAPPVHAESVAYATSLGAICVAAMGNSGREERYFPAALPDVIAVGAINADGRRAEFSTIGAHVALSAPGEEVISVGLDGYRASTGTSHAAPFVTATIALMLSLADRHGVTLTSADCRDILTRSATPGAPDAPANEIGAGQLNAAQALRLTQSFVSKGD